MYWRFVGPYHGVEKHVVHDQMWRRWGSVVQENFFGNVPIVHLFDRDDILEVFKSSVNTALPLRPPNMADVFYRYQIFFASMHLQNISIYVPCC